MEQQIKKLELRITELENQLKQAGVGTAQANIDPKDMEIFKKVSSQLGFDPEPCGINECQPVSVCRRCILCKTCSLCVVCRVCKVCIFECSCGPCNFGGGVFQQGLDRFGDLG